MTIYESYKSYCREILTSGKELLLGKKCKKEYIIMAIRLDTKYDTLYFEKRYYNSYLMFGDNIVSSPHIFIYKEPRKVKSTKKECREFHNNIFYNCWIDAFILNNTYIPIRLQGFLTGILYFPLPVKIITE